MAVPVAASPAGVTPPIGNTLIVAIRWISSTQPPASTHWLTRGITAGERARAASRLAAHNQMPTPCRAVMCVSGNAYPKARARVSAARVPACPRRLGSAPTRASLCGPVLPACGPLTSW
jgi:hypothetical protein